MSLVMVKVLATVRIVNFKGLNVYGMENQKFCVWSWMHMDFVHKSAWNHPLLLHKTGKATAQRKSLWWAADFQWLLMIYGYVIILWLSAEVLSNISNKFSN